MTETSMEMKIDYGCCELLENHAFADLAYENLKEIELPKFDQEDLDFAAKLESTIAPENVERARKLYDTEGLPLSMKLGDRNLYKINPLTASSDSGDVSHMMPMCVLSTTCWPAAAAPHTWQATAATGSAIGEKGAISAAQALAGIAYDLYTKPEVRETIQKEFQNKKEDYKPMYSE